MQAVVGEINQQVSKTMKKLKSELQGQIQQVKN